MIHKLLTLIGQRSSAIMTVSLVVAVLLPQLSSFMRPALPFLVALVLGISLARMEIADTLRTLFQPGRALRLLTITLLLMPLACLLMLLTWRALGLGEHYLILFVVFFAAPPISSAASLCFLLGYDARLSVQTTLFATLLTPPLGALCFILAGIDIDIPLMTMVLRITSMIAGGLVIGLGLQRLIGKDTIAQHPDALNGLATIGMVLVLFPLLDGAVDIARQQPFTASMVCLLAVLLNFGSHLLIRTLSKTFILPPSASALGLSFSNRNTSFYLAALPANPLLSLFVAAAQLPIYTTPALFRRYHAER